MHEIREALAAWDAESPSTWQEVRGTTTNMLAAGAGFSLTPYPAIKVRQAGNLSVAQRRLISHASNEVRLAKRAWADEKIELKHEREALSEELQMFARRLKKQVDGLSWIALGRSCGRPRLPPRPILRSYTLSSGPRLRRGFVRARATSATSARSRGTRSQRQRSRQARPTSTSCAPRSRRDGIRRSHGIWWIPRTNSTAACSHPTTLRCCSGPARRREALERRRRRRPVRAPRRLQSTRGRQRRCGCWQHRRRRRRRATAAATISTVDGGRSSAAKLRRRRRGAVHR